MSLRASTTDVGPDPIKWVERLEDVLDGSQFTEIQKRIIADGFDKIVDALIVHETYRKASQDGNG